LSHLKIKASDTPQWEWSTNQCRAWVIAVCITYLSFSLGEAEDAARSFTGFGPNIYLKEADHWKEIVGENNGAGVYSLLLNRRHNPGAVAKGVALCHGWSTEEANKNGRVVHARR